MLWSDMEIVSSKYALIFLQRNHILQHFVFDQVLPGTLFNVEHNKPEN